MLMLNTTQARGAMRKWWQKRLRCLEGERARMLEKLGEGPVPDGYADAVRAEVAAIDASISSVRGVLEDT